MIQGTVPQMNGVFKVRGKVLLSGCPVFGGYTVIDVLRYADRTVPLISIDYPVIKALMGFKGLDLHYLVVVGRQEEVPGVLTGYNVMTFLYKIASTNPEKLWAALYKTSVYDVDWLTLQAETTMSVEDLVTKMLMKRWGFASVRIEERFYLVSILDVIRFLVSSGAFERTSHRLLDIATRGVLSVGMDSTLFELLEVMVRKRIRRVVLEEEDCVVTDRGVLQYIISDQALETLRDSPKKLLATPLDALTPYAGKPVILGEDAPLSIAFKKLVEKEPYTVLTQDRKHILTPWDTTKLLKVS